MFCLKKLFPLDSKSFLFFFVQEDNNNNGPIGQLLSSSPVSSSPYFPGSPPSRAANPLAQDARFRDVEKLSPVSPNSPFLQPNSATAFPSPSASSSSSSSASSSRGCVRMKFGLKPPAVRVEGFECLNQNSGIPAMA